MPSQGGLDLDLFLHQLRRRGSSPLLALATSATTTWGQFAQEGTTEEQMSNRDNTSCTPGMELCLISTSAFLGPWGSLYF